MAVATLGDRPADSWYRLQGALGFEHLENTADRAACDAVRAHELSLGRQGPLHLTRLGPPSQRLSDDQIGFSRTGLRHFGSSQVAPSLATKDPMAAGGAVRSTSGQAPARVSVLF
ncbi:protein of unknown function [Streptomyces sp. KY75]|nr:protein of unknown function [Streptomyces sp. KY75]CAD5988208.1 protein of unknown function [Streptomyces sp. KY70]